MLGEWMLRSTDGGATWSAPYRCQVNSPHGPFQLADGRLLYAGKELWHGEHRNGVCESKDDGQSWQWLATIPTREGDRPGNYHELHGVETPTAGWWCRSATTTSRTRARRSRPSRADGGKTWSAPHAIGVWGLPSHLLRLQDNRLLMTYGHRRPPFGNQARLSEDGGRTWSEPLILSGDGAGGDLGYPSTVQLERRVAPERLVRSDEGLPRRRLAQARWKLG